MFNVPSFQEQQRAIPDKNLYVPKFIMMVALLANRLLVAHKSTSMSGFSFLVYAKIRSLL